MQGTALRSNAVSYRTAKVRLIAPTCSTKEGYIGSKPNSPRGEIGAAQKFMRVNMFELGGKKMKAVSPH